MTSDLDENAVIECMAEAIYRHSGGVTDDEFFEFMGEPRKAWKTEAPWDTAPDELCEHERDEYRSMARAAYAALKRCSLKHENPGGQDPNNKP